ncbi:unnamed protein product [Peronospora belbahrii]|uniref:Uncharacterized protein n=1 Tax=Peronospora belbahrii TaxID=622444 RepID=A0ABN8D289_9STRA|nr:unnamed protein product [Peronospora belbahrii]
MGQQRDFFISPQLFTKRTECKAVLLAICVLYEVKYLPAKKKLATKAKKYPKEEEASRSLIDCAFLSTDLLRSKL